MMPGMNQNLSFVGLLQWGFAAFTLLGVATGQDLKGLLKGSELVKNANSLYKTGRAYNKAACATLCGKLPGCNGWSYCDSKTGCGAGCTAYAKANGKLPKDSAKGYGTPYLGLALPVKKIGYWTYPKEGGSGCQGDKWAYGTCTLLKVADPKRPVLAVKASGWLSRTILPVPGCTKGLPWTCLNCNSAPNKAQCLACANANPIPGKQPLSGPLAYTNTAQGACLKCGKLPKGTSANQCFNCVTKKRPCATCAYTAHGIPEADVAACVSCAYADTPVDPFFSGAITITKICNDCARRPASKRAACLKCIRETPGLCKGADLFQETSCKGPGEALDGCNLCLNSPQCLACSAKKGQAACLACRGAKEAINDCFKCVASGKASCSTCVKDEADLSPDAESGAIISVLSDSCLTCYNDKTVRDASVCDTCNNYDGVLLGIDVDKCNKCVRDPKTEDPSLCGETN